VTRDETGTITAFVAIMTIALVFVAGLVFDGGMTLASRREAANVAEGAARAGAQALDVDVLRATGTVHLDSREAKRRAESYLAAAGRAGRVDISGDAVNVTVTITRRLAILGIAGLRTSTVTASGHARPVEGIGREGG
jgi:hypothetical protein